MNDRPKRGEVCLFTDGASRGNPGLAGAGVLITDSDGEPILEKAVFLGEATNNVAEYRALIIGLEELVKLAPRRVAIRMDSELIVRQINGTYRVRNPGLRPYYERARQLLARLERFTLNHVPRGENRHADHLANQAIDEKTQA